MNERFQRVEAEVARAQADISETKAIAREVVVRLTLLGKRVSASSTLSETTRLQ